MENTEMQVNYVRELLHELMGLQKRVSILEYNQGTLKNDSSVNNNAEIEKLKTEIKDLRNQNARLKDVTKDRNTINDEKFKQIKDELISVKNLNNQLTKESEVLRKIAYYDKDTGVRNSVLFDEEFTNIPKDEITLAIYSVCNTKIVNEKYGKSAGDGMILCVADALKEYFSVDNIYRVMGDKFFVITNKRYEECKSISKELIHELSENSITIKYAINTGDKFDTYVEFLNATEKKLNNVTKEPQYSKGNKSKIVDDEDTVSRHNKMDEYNESDDEIEDTNDEEVIKSRTTSIMDRFREQPDEEDEEDDGVQDVDFDDDDDEDETLFKYMNSNK